MTGPPTALVVHREKIDSWTARRRIPPAGRRIVYTDARGATVAVSGTLTAGEQAFRRVAYVYEVDVTPKSLSFDCALPSRGDAFAFDATVSATWVVHDERAVVDSGDVDGGKLARDFLEAAMPRISRRHHVTDAEETEEDLRRELGAGRIDLGCGIRLTGLSVRIRLEGDARSAVAAGTRAGWTTEQDTLDHRRTMHQGEQARERELADAEHRRRLEAAEQQHREMLDQRREEFERSLARARQEQNRALLEDGILGALAAHLNAHPEDTTTVLNVMTQRMDREDELVRNMVQQGIEEDLIEEHQVAGVMESAADRLRDRIADGRSPGPAAPLPRPALPAEPGPAGVDGAAPEEPGDR